MTDVPESKTVQATRSFRLLEWPVKLSLDNSSAIRKFQHDAKSVKANSSPHGTHSRLVRATIEANLCWYSAEVMKAQTIDR